MAVSSLPCRPALDSFSGRNPAHHMRHRGVHAYAARPAGGEGHGLFRLPDLTCQVNCSSIRRNAGALRDLRQRSEMPAVPPPHVYHEAGLRLQVEYAQSTFRSSNWRSRVCRV